MWGISRRTYVLDPATHAGVTDQRTGVTISDVRAVLDGDLDQLMLEGLRNPPKPADDRLAKFD